MPEFYAARNSFLVPLGLAALLTVVNALKPVVVDDTAYLIFAQQIVATPLQPYGPAPGTEICWYQQAEPAFEILLPPVLPYWLSLGMHLFGESIPLLKLWMFPFAWLFSSSLAFILGKIVPGFRIEGLLLLLLSPTFLPSMNFMLDIPALALGLTGIRVLWDAKSDYKAILSGLITGLAMQTKYTAFSIPCILLLMGLFIGSLRCSILAITTAAALFCGWELYVYRIYGHSHFLFHALAQNDSLQGVFFEEKWKLALALIGNLGGLFAVPSLVGWLALGFGKRFAYIGLGLIGLYVLALIGFPDSIYVLKTGDEEEHGRLTINSLSLMCLGTSSALAVLGSAFKLGISQRPDAANRSLDRFLILWLFVELGCYFALTPFPASRRLMGLVVIGTLVCLRAFQLRFGALPKPNCLRYVVAAAVVIGFFFAFVDLMDAHVEKNAIEEAKEWILQQPDHEFPIWFAGHWGVQWYGREAGMKELWPEKSLVHRGDWVILPKGLWRPSTQAVKIDPALLRLKEIPITRLAYGISLPIHTPLPNTISTYYGGKYPINRLTGPRVVLIVYRAEHDFEVRSRASSEVEK
ncbi:hypothetical protein KIH39_11065 [Telmatocola sphagniphila]|uniref:Glycosyltransferase RgtA/B/C/D-like domain-containing protein n=1 Tax=Telmatocola sphagniphila TaxID=1123043 RepID=A0A8E6BB00_9BACT|nr:hypothetical protein [Telmatocola sphagniphila]QVL34416.1 hypothetical protein KIH39_11065 [Telmatocola sphagniphila]